MSEGGPQPPDDAGRGIRCTPRSDPSKRRWPPDLQPRRHYHENRITRRPDRRHPSGVFEIAAMLRGDGDPPFQQIQLKGPAQGN